MSQEILLDYICHLDVLLERQLAFRNRSPTQHAVNLFSDFIRANMDKDLMTGAVYLNFTSMVLKTRNCVM